MQKLIPGCWSSDPMASESFPVNEFLRFSLVQTTHWLWSTCRRFLIPHRLKNSRWEATSFLSYRIQNGLSLFQSRESSGGRPTWLISVPFYCLMLRGLDNIGHLFVSDATPSKETMISEVWRSKPRPSFVLISLVRRKRRLRRLRPITASFLNFNQVQTQIRHSWIECFEFLNSPHLPWLNNFEFYHDFRLVPTPYAE
jgi:hypothetical protein